MTFSNPNRSPATLTKTRVKPRPFRASASPVWTAVRAPVKSAALPSGAGKCSIPCPLVKVTAGADKDYPWIFPISISRAPASAPGHRSRFRQSHLPGRGCQSCQIGVENKVTLSFPCFTGALGSTEIARVHWEAMAIGAAISGIIIVCGENVCGMDPQAEIKNGKVVRSPEMSRRVKIFKDWYQGKGDIIVQANVEDGRLGVPEYVIESWAWSSLS
jgi:hypothetical protein